MLRYAGTAAAALSVLYLIYSAWDAQHELELLRLGLKEQQVLLLHQAAQREAALNERLHELKESFNASEQETRRLYESERQRLLAAPLLDGGSHGGGAADGSRMQQPRTCGDGAAGGGETAAAAAAACGGDALGPSQSGGRIHPPPADAALSRTAAKLQQCRLRVLYEAREYDILAARFRALRAIYEEARSQSSGPEQHTP